jgi:hypothetical protein
MGGVYHFCGEQHLRRYLDEFYKIADVLRLPISAFFEGPSPQSGTRQGVDVIGSLRPRPGAPGSAKLKNVSARQAPSNNYAVL